MNFKKITDTSFKVNSQETRTMSGAAVVNFEHILHFILLLILLNKLMQVGTVSGNHCVFSNCEKYCPMG